MSKKDDVGNGKIVRVTAAVLPGLEVGTYGVRQYFDGTRDVHGVLWLRPAGQLELEVARDAFEVVSERREITDLVADGWEKLEGWVSTDEAMPPPHTRVLTRWETPKYVGAGITDGINWSMPSDFPFERLQAGVVSTPTHWRPLPPWELDR